MPPIHKAFETWEDVATSRANFTYKGFVNYIPITGEGKNSLGWVEDQEDWTNLGPEFTIYNPARCRVRYRNEDSPEIIEKDIYFNGANYEWSAEAVCPSDRMDIQNTTTHEVGHFLGLLDVSSLPERTMYEEAFWGETKKRTLESDDIAGASFLYPYEVAWSELMPCQSIADPLTLNVDVALSWNPTGREEYCHFACQEGYQFEGFFPDSAIPFDAPVSPVRVRYWNNNTSGDWDFLSDYHQRIYGPQLEITDNIVRA